MQNFQDSKQISKKQHLTTMFKETYLKMQQHCFKQLNAKNYPNTNKKK